MKDLVFRYVHIERICDVPFTEHLFEWCRIGEGPRCPKLDDPLNPCRAPDSTEYLKVGEHWVERA